MLGCTHSYPSAAHGLQAAHACKEPRQLGQWHRSVTPVLRPAWVLEQVHMSSRHLTEILSQNSAKGG